jgi:glycosyltransferase involved in cell wall biosynthesis
MKATVIIPALNEEKAIGRVVAEIPRHLSISVRENGPEEVGVTVSEIIVADNGSTDQTARVAEAVGARVVREERRGYGSACLAGVRAVRDADVIVFVDGDASDDPREMADVVGPIVRDQADLVIGSRVNDNLEAGALTPHQVFGNKVATTMIALLYGVKLTDIGSFRAIRLSALHELGMSHPTYGWPVEMLVKAARKNYRIVEVPITYRRRIGQSKVAGTVKGSLLAGYHIIKTILQYAL